MTRYGSILVAASLPAMFAIGAWAQGLRAEHPQPTPGSAVRWAMACAYQEGGTGQDRDEAMTKCMTSEGSTQPEWPRPKVGG